MTAANPNLDLIRVVARRLGPLRERVVFLGGATTGLLVTDPAAGAMRPTNDVDVIVEVASLSAYNHALRGELVRLGFAEDTEEGAPLCRWVVEAVKVDIMPTYASILGFSNRWYGPALEHATAASLPEGITIRLIAAPYFLATKLEAFAGRGGGDYAASHDLEDIVTVVDGRTELMDEVRTADDALRSYLAETVGKLLDAPGFQDALAGHLRGDPASQARRRIVLGRFERLAGRP